MRGNISRERGLTAALIIILASGCAASAGVRPEATEPAPEAMEQAPPVAENQDRMVRDTLAYPTGERATATLLIEKIAPRQIPVGERYSYTIRVTNLTDQPIHGVVVRESARGLEIERNPQAADQQGAQPGRWMVGTIPPHESRTLEQTAIASQAGHGSTCVGVEYAPQQRRMCSGVEVVNPQLQITKSAPARVLSCEEPSFTYRVTNTGSGIATNVSIHDALPQGLQTRDGRQEVAIEVGDLGAGQTRTFTVPLKANGPGTFESRAMARSDAASAVSNPIRFQIAQPSLHVQVAGPDWQYAGKPVTYTIRITNESDVPAPQTRLLLQSNQQLSGADDRMLGTIQPGETKVLTVAVPNPNERIELQASARSACASPAMDQVATEVRSVPALHVETIDTRDPVAVGEVTNYQVSVTNQGQAPATNVEITAQIPPNMTLLGVQGATRGRLEGRTLHLAPVRSLPGGATARWNVEVRADEPGLSRFRAEVGSDILDRPVPSVEPTQVIEPQG